MKLVRDLIPEIIIKSGRTPIFHVAELNQYKELLKHKLFEEVKEFSESESMGEIADILGCVDKKISVAI